MNITIDHVESFRVGQHVEWWVGGEEDNPNDQRLIAGVIKAIAKAAPSTGTTGNDKEEVAVRVGNANLYTWKGFLRCGSGAEVVRDSPLSKEQQT